MTETLYVGGATESEFGSDLTEFTPEFPEVSRPRGRVNGLQPPLRLKAQPKTRSEICGHRCYKGWSEAERASQW